MNDFERKLAAQPFREPPADLRRHVLAVAQTSRLPYRRLRACLRADWKSAIRQTKSSALRRAAWREWLWPSPAAWGALAALWLVFAAVDALETPPAPAHPVATGEALRDSPLLTLRSPQQIRHALELTH